MACAPRPPTASSNRNDDNAAPLPDAIPPSDSVYALLRTPSGRSAMTASPIYENIPDLLEEKPSNGTLSPREQKRHAFWSGMIDQSRMISFTRSDSQAKQHIPTKKLPARTKKKLDSNELCCACTLDPVELSSGGVGASYVNGSYTCDISDEDVGTLAAAASRNRLRLTLDLKDAEKSAEEARSMWCRSPDAFSSFVANSPVVKKLRDFGFYYPGKEERSRRRSLHCAIVVLVVIVIALVVLNALVPFLIRRNVTTVNEHVPSTAPLPYISGTSDNQGPSSQVEKIILITGRPFQISRHKMPVDRSRTSELVVAESSTTTALPTSTELAATASAPPATTESSTTLNAASPTATTILATTTSPAVSTWLPVFDPDVVCNPDQFKCSSGVSRIPCLYNWERCDGIADCSDGSDERFCDKLHCYGNFECDNGDCVALDKVCNGIPDCNDGSDETKCAAFQCQAYEYRCPSGYCIPKEWICDGEQDCSDHREEYNCSDSCAPNQFLCQEGWCISDAWRCNGVADCAGGEDEADCACSVDQIRCHTGQCLHESKQCNGISDCPDHSDEWGCERLRPDGLTEVHNGNATGVLCFDNFADQTAQFVCQRFGRGLPQAKTAVLTGESLVRLQLSDKSGGGGQISDCESDHALAVDCDGSTCGVWHPTKSSSSRAKRVVGGHVSGQHQWPSLALLYHPRNKGACTASIISSVWLLTSALCVRRIDADPGDWRVIAGNAQPNETDTTTMTRMIAEFITHPNYKFRTMVASNDVMLVRLQKELPLNKARLNGLLGAICLPPRETDDQNTFCVTAGWGYTNPGGYYINKQLRHLEMSVWKSAECNSSDHYSGLIDPTILCASSKEQEWGPCFNDEGSPLMCHDAVSGRWYLAGILTTHRCGSRNHPAIFADIFAVKEWISHLVFRSAQRLHETTE